MAEFVEVIKNRKRMCKSYTCCEKCQLDPLYNNFLTCEELLSEYPQEVEEIIMKWAEEHPIKTNVEKFCNEICCQQIECSKCEYKGDK